MNVHDEIEEKELEEFNNFAKVSLKKHMSTPPPGLVSSF